MLQPPDFHTWDCLCCCIGPFWGAALSQGLPAFIVLLQLRMHRIVAWPLGQADFCKSLRDATVPAQLQQNE